ncbi:MAG: preprotein translocase subunit SecA, partial [Alphaproteobacteria bacterium]|nr:preprotein translocase subunit SecA [Alphaproteobacteria bacterium]
MFSKLIQRLFGSANDRYLNGLKPLVQDINKLEAKFEQFSDAELKDQTRLFKERIRKGESLDSLLVEAFAVVREASKRTLGLRHFDVQLMGGILLHRGMIAEMATGEGKTLVSTLPVYLNALSGLGVHVVTVNDYLASRDAFETAQIHSFLGLSVGCILNSMDDDERRGAYNCDITYGTNNEYGFDYLRDNMKFRLDQMVQRQFNFAIVDEVDSILVDEARTPLIISGPAEDSSELYKAMNTVVPHLEAVDFEKDEKARAVTLTEAGSQKIEVLLQSSGMIEEGTLYDINNIMLVHHVNQALKAHKLFTRDVDYIVKDDKVIIIDEFTGRMMEGRRYSDGLHQALEAKEGVHIQMENQTLASITFQNYFRLYKKLAGMTGTAATEAAEFADIYKLEVVSVPTNLPMARVDADDEIYRTAKEKYDAIITLIEECYKKQQPALVGTTSIERSEYLATLLKQKGIPHQVLNARYHEQEAMIISQAGRPGAVTIATNMAGRGTDIKLGGNLDMRLKMDLADITDPKEYETRKAQIEVELSKAGQLVRDAGGLYVIGTERHESRRIDNQLRGRSARQGDPGCSKFYLSLEDDLMRIFGSQRLDAWLQKLGLQEGESIVHPWINKSIERAQQKVEARNFDIRKHLLKYDDVMNDQRKIIYEQRRILMEKDDASEAILDMRKDVLENMVRRFIPENAYSDQWDVEALHEECLRIFAIDFPVADWVQEEGIADLEIIERISHAVDDKMLTKEKLYGASMLRVAEKSILLRILDQAWKDHLFTLDHLRQGINLRAYAQRDPLNEYKQEAFILFQDMLARVREMVTSSLFHLTLNEATAEDIYEAAFEDVAVDPSSLEYHKPTLDGDEKPTPVPSKKATAKKTSSSLAKGEKKGVSQAK